MLVVAAVVTTIADRTVGIRLVDDAEKARREGRLVQASALYDDAVSYVTKQYGTHSAKLADILDARAGLYMDEKHYDLAESDLLRSRMLRLELFGLNNRANAVSEHRLGAFYTDQAKFAEAEHCLQRALSISEKSASDSTENTDLIASVLLRVHGPSDPETASILSDLGWLYNKQGSYDRSESAYKRALSLRQAVLIPSHPAIAKNVEDLGLVYSLQGKFHQQAELAQHRITSPN